ncbi:TIR domain-containing protein [Paractinoplanes durhamensis]|uniref:TIR domain-containing protein n=1 Tax=Paractinoplanes durhamensis TaxID=113563 RepID=UPI001943EE1A|nr:TIR domain-containing protein [Actinoplanes durhamensis]
MFAVLLPDVVQMYRLSAGGDPSARDAAKPVWEWNVWGFTRTEGQQPQALTFTPDGRRIAVLDGTSTFRMLSVDDGREGTSLWVRHPATSVRWAPVGDRFVIQGDDGTYLGGGDSSKRSKLISTAGSATPLAWSPDGKMLCRADPRTLLLRIWDVDGRLLVELEGMLASGSVSFSADGRFLYALGAYSVCCWRTDTWQRIIGDLITTPSRLDGDRLAVSPGGSHLALWDQDRRGFDLYAVDADRLLRGSQPAARTYRNAKVVLVGETGVGKSGLGLVLSNQAYRPTDSTHARQVFTFEETEVELPDGGAERRETLLWDMAGQSGYRLIHQLHLAEAAAALVVFDARSETDPFAGVRYWARALRQQSAAPAMLVAARTDRGGIAAGDKRITAICEELGLSRYFETSAREGWQIPELAEAMRAAIDWDSLPLSVSTELFETIKQFLLEERDGQRILATAGDLYRDFRRHHASLTDGPELRLSFDACVRLLELRDLVRRLSFGGFVLLRPEMLDFYASALIDEARAQPDGLGYLAERRALAGDFPMPQEDRLPSDEERLLLIAVVEEMLRHDLALRESTEAGVDLVFPSQLTADRPTEGDPDAADVVFQFDGAVPAIYATLAVRLSRVTAYSSKEKWRNGSTYWAKAGGVCGVRVVQAEEGRGELTVFYDGDASEETRFLFEDYVHTHLMARALDGSVRRERLFTCPRCSYRVDPAVVRRRLERGAIDVLCTDCEQVRIVLLDRKDRLAHAAAVRDMNASADAGRDAAANTATIRGKLVTQDYDVFLSYNSADREVVGAVAERLRAAGVLAWIDQAGFAAGDRWRDLLEEQIARVRAGAVFLGPHGLGRWQKLEEQALIDESTRRGLRIIPVLLPGLPLGSEPRGFLGQWQAADFRVAEPDPFTRLLEGIKE